MNIVVEYMTKNVPQPALECRVTKMTIARQTNIVVECMTKNVPELASGWDVEAMKTVPLGNAVTTRRNVERNVTQKKGLQMAGKA
jgi:hypothetical protein